jgi:hypothetical protein
MADNSKELLANIAPFGLRMQADLKEEIKASADRSGRSMNAEIVHRLERSLQWDEDGQQEANELIAALETKLAEAVKVNEYLESLRADLIDRLDRASNEGGGQEEPIFNIVLDAKGHPLSWPEIAAHIHRTAKAAGIETAGFRVAVFNSDKEKSGDRDKEYARLVRWYQDQTRKHKDEIREP